MRRGGSISSSSRTCSACATLISTASVGLAAPDSRLAQVARGMPATRAICCCDCPRASRSVWMLRPRFDRRARSRLVGRARLGHGGQYLTACQSVGKTVDILSRPASSILGRRDEKQHGNETRRTERAGDRRQPRAGARAGAGGPARAAGARVVLVARERGPLATPWRTRSAPPAATRTRSWRTSPTATRRTAIAGQAAALVGPIDVLVNNASTLGPVPLRLLLDTDCEDLERALAVNLVGPFRLTKAVAGPMLLRGRGHDREHHVGRRDRGVRDAGARTARRRRRWSSSGGSGRRSWRARACASSPSTRARWTRACTRTRSPTPTRPRWPIPARRRGAHRGACWRRRRRATGGIARRDPAPSARRRVMKRRTTYPGPTRRRAPAGRRSRGRGGRRAAGDAHRRPARFLRAGRSAGRQRRGDAARVAARARRRRARHRGAAGRRAPTVARRSPRCCSAPATGTRAPRIARRRPSSPIGARLRFGTRSPRR